MGVEGTTEGYAEEEAAKGSMRGCRESVHEWQRHLRATYSDTDGQGDIRSSGIEWLYGRSFGTEKMSSTSLARIVQALSVPPYLSGPP